MRSEDPKSEVKRSVTTEGSPATRPRGFPGEIVTALKVVFNPKEIYSCGPLQNNGRHVIGDVAEKGG